MYRIEIDRQDNPWITETKPTFPQARKAVMDELKGLDDAKEARIIYTPEWRIVWRQEIGKPVVNP